VCRRLLRGKKDVQLRKSPGKEVEMEKKGRKKKEIMVYVKSRLGK